MSRERTESIDLALFEAAQSYLRSVAQNRLYGAAGLAAWERFYSICDQLIHRFATAFGARAANLDDCSQETWAELVELLIHFHYDPQRGDFRTWLYRIVRSATVNFLRRRSHQQNLQRKLSEMDAPSHEEQQTPRPGVSMERLLHRARRCLTPQNYRLMCLRWVDGQDVPTVARRMHMSHEQVWHHEHRIRKTLRRALEGVEEGAIDERRTRPRPAAAGESAHVTSAAQ
jgi:RNA polymerase sigma factor (sigma-70 family)